MCGLCGFTGEVVDREEVIRNMTRVITHRGPDSDGFFTDYAAQNNKPLIKVSEALDIASVITE